MTQATQQPQTGGPGSATVEVYWTPGCSSCLRMKEFVERMGVPYEAMNVKADPVAAARLRGFGAEPPAIIVGDRWARGGDLVAVAELLDVDYSPPVILPTAELMARYHTMVDTLCRLVAQADREALAHRRPERARTTRDIAYHVATVLQFFLNAYDPDAYDAEMDEALAKWEDIDETPEGYDDAAAIIARAREVEALVDAWWERDGHDDPLDQVIETYWGYHTALEAFEREVWHMAHHLRQLAMFLEEVGIVPDRPLGEAELAGLPLPERGLA